MSRPRRMDEHSWALNTIAGYLIAAVLFKLARTLGGAR